MRRSEPLISLDTEDGTWLLWAVVGAAGLPGLAQWGATVPGHRGPSPISSSQLGTCQLVAGVQGGPESHCALTLRRLNSNTKKNLHRESQNGLELNKLDGIVFSSQL